MMSRNLLTCEKLEGCSENLWRILVSKSEVMFSSDRIRQQRK